ncbi:flagellar hook-associated protein FlgL [Maioricimonas rarisocia]|uniref:Flagellar hook-associated protein FlgL n=1 Tax=Maioricimonas rarisocia TaxID=2528026 RepID=A0A517ZCS5_9PLAN|nr:flagellar hook-associated protein FlgL [Maioricimonas rarisocia]QDU40240.1 flagellar hook-associated protein FlgL [Maioricimonas rarisocia]
MSLRVTPHQLLSSMQSDLTRQQSRAADLQRDITSGVRIHRPSDDPHGQEVVLQQTAAVQRYETQLGAIGEARNRLNNAQTQLQEAQQLLASAEQIALQARQATDPTELTTLAGEVDSLLQQLVGIANAEYAGESLFAGTATGSSAWTVDGSGVPTEYVGSDVTGQILLGGQTAIDVFYTGDDVFGDVSRGDTVIFGQSGAVPAGGTDTARGSDQLIVRHTATTYAGASGIQPGTSSADGDTVIGALGTHQLQITDTAGDGSAGFVSLNGGPEFPFTSGDTNLEVTGPNGEVVYVDTTAISAGFNGTVDLTADGTLSIDGGSTEVPINFSASQTVTDGVDGTFVRLDTTGVTRAGVDIVEYPGTANAFQALAQLRDTILNSAELSPAERDEQFALRLDDLQRQGGHMLDVIGQQSITLQQLDRLELRTEDLMIEAETVRIETETTDFASTILAFQEEQTMIQYTLASLARVYDVSVLDFIR